MTRRNRDSFIILKRVIQALTMVLLSSCGEMPTIDQPSSTMSASGLLSFPAPLEGETVTEGHLCDPSAIARAFRHKYPSIDPTTVQQETDHLLYVFGCGGSPEEAAPSFTQLDNCAALQSAATDRERYGIPTPPEDQAALSKCGREPPAVFSQSNVSQGEIQLERRGSAYLVPVRINQTLTLPFILDTGADELVIPVDVALTLIRAGALTRDDFIGEGRYTMANGSEETQDRVVIREVQVGNHTARDVTASVSSATSNPLLGESFLSQFGTVTIDYNRLVLILSR